MSSEFNHKEFIKGWLVGDFSPSLFKSKDIEVGLKYYNSGFKEKAHYHKISTEYTLVVKGKAKQNILELAKNDETYPIHYLLKNKHKNFIIEKINE